MRRAASLIALAIALASCDPAPAPAGAHRWYGVTLDDVTRLDQIVTSLARLPRRPAVRIVFDPGVAPARYRAAVDRVAAVGDILAEPVDSSAATQYTTAQYTGRFRQYLAAFAAAVPVWEIGNEVNGDWLGPADRVRADIAAAYQAVRAYRRQTALTLSYEPGCAAAHANDMWTWAATNITSALKAGLDYVLVSYYADDCDGYQPTDQEWTMVFRRLHQLFPHAKLGFGEVGTHLDATPAAKRATLERYYRLSIDAPGYISGCFWWYYAEDMIPYQRSVLWRALASLMS